MFYMTAHTSICWHMLSWLLAIANSRSPQIASHKTGGFHVFMSAMEPDSIRIVVDPPTCRHSGTMKRTASVMKSLWRCSSQRWYIDTAKAYQRVPCADLAGLWRDLVQNSLRDLVPTLRDLVRTLTDHGTARTGGYQLDGTRGPPALEGTSLTAQSDEPRFVAMVCKCLLCGTS